MTSNNFGPLQPQAHPLYVVVDNQLVLYSSDWLISTVTTHHRDINVHTSHLTLSHCPHTCNNNKVTGYQIYQCHHVCHGTDQPSDWTDQVVVLCYLYR